MISFDADSDLSPLITGYISMSIQVTGWHGGIKIDRESQKLHRVKAINSLSDELLLIVSLINESN